MERLSEKIENFEVRRNVSDIDNSLANIMKISRVNKAIECTKKISSTYKEFLI